MARPVWAEVNLQAIRDNTRAIRGLLGPDTALMAVVKANGYGHGLVQAADAAVQGGAERLGVAIVEEAVELRRSGSTSPIQILSEAPESAAGEIVDLDLIPTVYSPEAAEAISRTASNRGTRVDVHLKIDTGMHRVGVAPSQVLELYQFCRNLPGIRVEGAMTHFACADDPTNDYTKKQLAAFLEFREELADVPLWHAANSAATLFMPQTHLNMVRIGIAMYGLQPASRPSPVPLVPALTLKSRVAFVQDLPPGEGVSYGLTYVADRRAKMAVLPIGYGDGFSRLLSNRGAVLINERRVRLIGNICMDQSLVEVDELTKVGDEAVLIGRQGNELISAEEIASILGTINYEVVCMINGRVPRRYLNLEIE